MFPTVVVQIVLPNKFKMRNKILYSRNTYNLIAYSFSIFNDTGEYFSLPIEVSKKMFYTKVSQVVFTLLLKGAAKWKK